MAITKAYASNAERLGFSTLWVPEHVVLVDKYASKYPYSGDGVLPAATDAPIADPFISLTAMAAATEKIRLGTGICLVPEHNPVVLAKVVATLDWMSNGRVALGVGIGWLEEEFQAIGIPWERRAARTRDCINAMRKLWGEAISSYSGEFVKFEGVRSNPKPIRGADLADSVRRRKHSCPAARCRVRQRMVRLQSDARRHGGEASQDGRIAEGEPSQALRDRDHRVALYQDDHARRSQALSRCGRA